MKLTTNQKAVGLLLIFAIIFGFLLTPLGLEPRNPDLRSYAIVPFFIAASLGFPILALVFLTKRPRIAGILVTLNGILMPFLVAGDQAGFFFTSEPPLAITVFEFLSMVVAVGFVLYGPALYRQGKAARKK